MRQKEDISLFFIWKQEIDALTKGFLNVITPHGDWRRMKEELYNKIPSVFKKSLSLIPKKIIFGKSYSQYLKLIESTENFNYEQKLVYQTNKLREISIEAYYHTDFWKEIFDKSNVKPENIELEDLKKMPLISSETIKLNYEKMISKRYINKGYWVTTGGTGRSPTPIFLSNESFGIEWAFKEKSWHYEKI